MKIRKGFVSNSSSSSFVIIDKGVTTGEIAAEMVKIIEKEYKEFAMIESDMTSDIGHSCTEKALEFLAINPKFDKPILIPWSCNEDTLIAKEDNVLKIETCRNHDWSPLEKYNFKYEGESVFFEETENFLDLSSDEIQKPIMSEEVTKAVTSMQESLADVSNYTKDNIKDIANKLTNQFTELMRLIYNKKEQ